MDELLDDHVRRTVSLLNERVHTASELRAKLKVDGMKFARVMTTLDDLGVVEQRKGLRGEGLRLTAKGHEVAASLAVLSILTISK